MNLLILLPLSSAVFASQCGVHLPWRPRPRNAVPSRFERSIIGGRKVDTPGKWPWQVYILDHNDGLCGGTVIAQKWILTAAHCIKNGSVPKSIHAFVGFNKYFGQRLEPLPPAVRAIVHPDHSDDKINDIALIELERLLIFNHAVSSICLPTKAQVIPADGQAVAIGFGKSNVPGVIDELANDNILREVVVPIVDPHDCENRWRVVHPFEEWRTAKLVCASSLAHGVHKGDSGGPLMMKSSDGRWFEIGIAMFIHEVGTRHDVFPDLFIDVRPYCDWIKQTTNGEASCQDDEVTLEDVRIQS